MDAADYLWIAAAVVVLLMLFVAISNGAND
jgi:hypothetical protein